MIRTIIVEDELNIQELLTNLIVNNIEAVSIVGKAQSVSTAITLIKKHKPDLVLMDIEILEGSGFDVISQTIDIDFEVVFITGYQQYAIEALRNSAIDYLLKPLSIKDLKEAFIRFKEKVDRNKNRQSSTNLFVEGVFISRRINLDDLLYIEIRKSICLFHFVDGSQFHSIKPISYYINDLPNYILKSHRNYFINVNHIKDIESGRGGMIVFSNDESAPVSYRRKQEIIKFWKE